MSGWPKFSSSPLTVRVRLLAALAGIVLLLAGPAAHIHRDSLTSLESASDPLAAHAWLLQQGLLGTQEVTPCSN